MANDLKGPKEISSFCMLFEFSLLSLPKRCPIPIGPRSTAACKPVILCNKFLSYSSYITTPVIETKQESSTIH